MVNELITALFIYLSAQYPTGNVIYEGNKYARCSSYSKGCDIITVHNKDYEYIGSVKINNEWIPIFTLRPEDI